MNSGADSATARTKDSLRLMMSSSNTSTDVADSPLISTQRLLRKGSFTSHVLTLTAGSTFSQAVNAAGTLVLARLFSPADFGLLALFMAITAFLSVVGSWRYETAVMLPEEEREAANLQVLALLILLGMCALSLVCVAVGRHPIAVALGEPQLAPWLWGVPISLLATGLYQIASYWASRMKYFHLLAISRVSQTVGVVGIQLGLLALGLRGPLALILGWVAGQVVGTITLMWRAVLDEGEFLIRSFDWSLVRAGFFKYKNFPLYTAPYSFCGNGAKQLTVVILRVFVDIGVVGWFSMARRVVSLPLSLVTVSMNQVFYEKAATEMKAGRLEPFVSRVIKLQIALGTPLLVYFMFEAPLLFRIALGPVWATAGAYAALLSVSGFVDFVTSWMDRIFDVKGRQRLALIWEIVRDAIVIGCFAVTLWGSHSPLLGVTVYIALDFICSVIWLLIVYQISDFLFRNLWHIGGLFVGIGSVATILLWVIGRTFSQWQAFGIASALTLATEGFIFLKYSKGSRLL